MNNTTSSWIFVASLVFVCSSSYQIQATAHAHNRIFCVHHLLALHMQWLQGLAMHASPTFFTLHAMFS